MFKMIVGTLVALYCILLIFGDESRRPEDVVRAEAPVLDFDLASWIAPVTEVTVSRLPAPEIGEQDAIAMAIEAGTTLRQERAAAPLIGSVVAVVEDPETSPEIAVAEETASAEPLIAAVEAPEPDRESVIDRAFWYVTGTTVNVRAGPGTDNPVVTQVQLGDAAEVLSQSESGWVEIKPDGSETVGWISGRFLTPDAPG